MISKDCKRLAEVDFPIAEVSRHAAREKSIRHGHPSTLHLWWARRPLASCRAMLLGLLWPDPCDPHCPRHFKEKARELLPGVQGRVGPADEDLRKALLKFIADFANWDLATNRSYLEVCRKLVKAAHGDEPPLVVDPFAGGGSIPLEALRLGCEAFASDLNPVACLIVKVMLEDIPRANIHHRDTENTEGRQESKIEESKASNSVSSVPPWCGNPLAEELRRVGAQIKKQAEEELADLYPKDPDGATPIAYLCARTVRCEAPNCGAEIPLLRSFWLCKKSNRKRALRFVRPARSVGSARAVGSWEIFEPRDDKEVPAGTVSRARATCLCCGSVLPPERVRAQLAAQRGGADVVFHHGDTESTEREHSVSSVPLWWRTGGARLLAMLAQWISLAAQDAFRKARTEPLITLGSAPLGEPGFRSVILGQLGESRLVAAIDADIAGEQAHAKALDADTKGPLRDIHRRVGTTILFESSGGQTDKVAHLPELRFALGEPEVDTTSVDNAAFALEDKSYFIRKVGSDGFKIGHQPTMRKVVSDRRASLDEETEIKPAMRKLVEDQFRRGATIPVVAFPRDGAEIPDSPRLTLVVVDPEAEWTGGGPLREQIAEWTKQRGKSPRLYPGSLVWCIKKPGRDLREKVELWLAWKRVAQEVADGTLGGDFDRSDRADLQSKVAAAEEAAKDEVWGGYRFAVIYNPSPPAPLPGGEGSPAEGLKTIDLGAGHSSSGETLCGRVIAALKSAALLNESVGAGYIDRNWPPALKESGAWPLASLRQSFLNGSLTRLFEPDTTLRGKIVEFVGRGDFGLASGLKGDGTYERIWFREPVTADEVAFESGVFLLTKAKAQALKTGEPEPAPGPEPVHPMPGPEPGLEPEPGPEPAPGIQTRTIRLVGAVPPEVWNRLGTKLLPKLRTGSDLKIGVDFSVTVHRDVAKSLTADLRRILADLELTDTLRIQDA